MDKYRSFVETINVSRPHMQEQPPGKASREILFSQEPNNLLFHWDRAVSRDNVPANVPALRPTEKTREQIDIKDLRFSTY